MSQYESGPSGMAVGGALFAGVIMIMIGVFQAVAGVSAIAKDDLFVVTENYVFDLSVTGGGGSTSHSESSSPQPGGRSSRGRCGAGSWASCSRRSSPSPTSSGSPTTRSGRS